MTIQSLLDATPAGHVCTFPGGTIDLPAGTTFTVPRSMTINGNGTHIRVAGTAPPTIPLFALSALPDGSDITIRDLTITGPDTNGWSQHLNPNIAAVDWTLARTWNSSLTLDHVSIGGGYAYAVQRAGGGRFRILDCALSGYVGAFSFFESHGGWGDLIVRDSLLCAPALSKYDSIGAYIHPHLHVTWERVAGSGWNRYLCYLNGTPQSAGHHDFLEVTATDCSLIQTGSSSVTTLVRCVEQGTVRNGGSFFKGPVTSVGSRWASNGMIGFLNNNPVDRHFARDTYAGTGTWMAGGNQTNGTVTLDQCAFQMAGAATGVRINSNSTIAATLRSCMVTGTTTGYTLLIEGGSVRLVDTPTPARVRVAAPGVLTGGT